MSDVPFESGEDTMDGGDGVYEVIKVVRGDSGEILDRLLAVKCIKEPLDIGDSSLQRFLSCSGGVSWSFSTFSILSLSSEFSRRSASFSSLSLFAIFCRATLRSISPCSYD